MLSAAEVAGIRAIIDAAEWIDGNATSGHQAALAKNNEQLPEDSDAAKQAAARSSRPSVARRYSSPRRFRCVSIRRLFNRYGAGQGFDTHVDNAIRIKRGSEFRMRGDLSITVFLEAPENYDGGELLVEDHYGVQRVKLPAGHAVVYPRRASTASP